MHKNTEVTMVHYADDITSNVIVDSLESMVLPVNLQIDKIDSWLCSKKLSHSVA